jgi:uncharacterized protein (TIGR02118 family)
MPRMTIAYLLTYTGPGAAGDALRAWLKGAPVAFFRRAKGIASIDLYEPETSARDPYLDDGAPPLATLQAAFATLGELEAALASAEFRAAIVAPSPAPPDAARATHEAMDWRFYPVKGEAAPAPLRAACSYVVRYHRPAEDEAAFVKFYVEHHPPLLGKFPNIRNVMCYLPIAWRDPTPIAHSDYMLGNEVVFDTLADLNASLKSEVRHELREDFKRFPKFTGRNTHFAMRRTRLHG